MPNPSLQNPGEEHAGSLLLTAILHQSLAKNHIKGVDGGVAPNTYIAFVIIECLA